MDGWMTERKTDGWKSGRMYGDHYFQSKSLNNFADLAFDYFFSESEDLMFDLS